MSLLGKSQEVVLCSPMEGVITLDGKPVVGAQVERWIKWKDEAGETDTVTTNDNGEFNFPVKKDTVKLSPLSQFVMGQEIRVYFNNKKYLIWTMGKRSKEEYGELGGRPVNFRCELTDELVPVSVEEGLLGTSCKWDAIEKSEG